MQILNDFDTTVKLALAEIDPQYEKYDALVIAGTHTPHDIDELLNEIARAWEDGTPYLGICFGHQLAAVVYGKKYIGLDATSEEFDYDPGSLLVVRKLPELKVGVYDGESYWNNYEVVIDWEKPDHFVTTQYHPEYQSSKDKPHKDLINFIDICKKHIAIGQPA